MSIIVKKGQCPLTKKIIYALYLDNFPIIPATIYLRYLACEVELRPNTLAARTYALRVFFEFLETANLTFWQITPGTIKQFKRFQLGLMRPGRANQLLKRKSAQQYLLAVKGLIQYWRGSKTNDPFFEDQIARLEGRSVRKTGRGLLAHISWTEPVANTLWKIRIPTQERHTKRNIQGLSKTQCQSVFTILNIWKSDSAHDRLVYYRNRAIWVFLLMTGLRKAELCRIRVTDIDPCAGIVNLTQRMEDEWLGSLKSGPGEIFVTTENPLWHYIDSWLLEGRWIAENLLEQKGIEDHQMLFTKSDGSPLTRACVDYLFATLRKSCGFMEIPFYPHVTRHTIATAMLESGVDLVEIQRFLRHRSLTSTEAYAKISVTQYRQLLTTFWNNFEVNR